MKVYFNSLGVITSTDTTGDALRQGAVGIELKAYFDGENNANYIATLNFTRSDGSSVAGIIMNIDETDSECFKYKFNDPWFFAKYGITTLSIYLRAADESVKAQGQVTFNIEKTDYDDDPDITVSQYNSLLARLLTKEMLPTIDVESTDNVVEFIEENECNNKPVILNIEGTNYAGVLNYDDEDDTLLFELEALGSAIRFFADELEDASELTFADLIDESNRSDYEIKKNKVTSLSSGSTDEEYPSAKCVYEELNEKVEKETGKELVPTSKVQSYDEHLNARNNPHEVTKGQVGLGNVINTGDSDIPTENGTEKFTTGGAYRMQQAIDSLSSAGRFLSLWDATTGEALSDPPTTPIYQYQAGDYFRVSVGGNRVPVGSQYNTQGTNYTTVATSVVLGDVFYYDGTQWVLQSGSGAGSVLDVKFLGNSVVAAGIANITKQLVLDAIYPVGSIYMSVEQDEATKNTVGKYGCKLANLGGTWERLENKFLVGANDEYVAGSTGGYKVITPSGTLTGGAVLGHTLTVDEIPSHNHGVTWSTNTRKYLKHIATSGGGDEWVFAKNTTDYQGTWNITIGNKGGGGSHTHEFTQPTFTGTEHSNLPPYLAVYMWKRIG